MYVDIVNPHRYEDKVTLNITSILVMPVDNVNPNMYEDIIIVSHNLGNLVVNPSSYELKNCT